MKTLPYLYLLLIAFTTFSCKKENTLTTATIKEVTKEHQMIYVWSLNAILNQENEMSDFIFGGEEKNLAHTADYKASLKEWWEVNSKKDLEESINTLIGGRMHHPAFMEEYDGFFDISEAQFQQSLKDNPEYQDLDRILWNNKTLFKTKGILAWDIVRATALIGWGYQAGYLTMDEAYLLSLAAGTAAQQKFTSHTELYENYLAGYLYWSRDKAAYDKRAATVAALLKDTNSAWNIFPFDYDMTKK